MLYEYMRQVQRFIRDSGQQLVDPGDLIDYVNRARRQVAMQAECIRILAPISGQIYRITVTNGGGGYTNPTVVISAPDSPTGRKPFPGGAQASATCTFAGGIITSVNVVFGGDGYFQPVVTISDPTGNGAVIVPSLTQILATSSNQEVYNFSDVPLANFPGVQSVLSVRSVSLIYSNYRYSLPQYAFSEYQSKIRQFPYQYYYVPTMCSQFGQGTAGSLYMYPIASTQYQMEWDTLCLPSDLLTDNDVEAIPMPWTEAVAYFAAHLAFLELQNMNAAMGYFKLFDQMMHRYGASARVPRRVNPYGKYIIPIAVGFGAVASMIPHLIGGVIV